MPHELGCIHREDDLQRRAMRLVNGRKRRSSRKPQRGVGEFLLCGERGVDSA
jgi:hypothetical protein